MSPTIGIVAGSFRRGGGSVGNIDSPADIPGLVLWLKSDSGLSVSAWADQSGNGYDLTQATAGNQPSIVAGAVNGYAAAEFDGAGDHYAGSIPYSAACTVFVVRKLHASPINQNQTPVGEYSSVDAARRNFIARCDAINFNRQSVYVDPVPGGDSFLSMTGSDGRVVDAWAVQGTRYGGTVSSDCDHYYDSDTAQNHTTSTIATAPTTMDLIRVGKGGTSNGYFKGQIAEICIWHRVLTNQEIADLRNYLGITRYALHAVPQSP